MRPCHRTARYAHLIEAGSKVHVPDKDLWFWLDEHPGTETIYVLASAKPLRGIRGLLAKMEINPAQLDDGASALKQRMRIIERGIGGLTKSKADEHLPDDREDINRVTQVVASTGATVRVLSFLHR